MMYKLLLSVLLVSCVGVVHINAQPDCAPLTVVNVTISLDAELSWQPNPQEICDISYYLVTIESVTGPHNEYIYAVARTTLLVDFLPVCEDYLFTVTPISTDNLEGTDFLLATKIPLPANANLTVAYLRVTSLEGESVFLDWGLETEWQRCADRYRVIVDDQDLDYLQDIYTYNNSLTIPSLAPCTSYEFGIIAIYSWEIEGPVSVVQYSSPPAEQIAPTLTNLVAANTYANITWRVQPYPQNKCAVTQVAIEVKDLSQRSNFTISILDQINRQPLTITVPDLKPDSLYLVNTTIINTAGPSTPALIAVQTRP